MAYQPLRGLTPYKKKNGEPYTGGVVRYLVSNGYGTAIGAGDMVTVTNGYVTKVTNSSATAFGVFAGCKYVDPTTGQPVESTYFAANTSSKGTGPGIEGETHVIAYVVPGDGMTFLMEAQGSVSANDVGALFDVSVGTADAIRKRSVTRMEASATTSADKTLVRLLSFPNISGSSQNDNPTFVEVEIVSPALA